MVLSGIMIAGITLAGCQDGIINETNDIDSTSTLETTDAQHRNTASQKVENYIIASDHQDLSDKEIDALSEIFFGFTNEEYISRLDLSFQEAIDNATTQDELDEYEQRYNNALMRNEESLVLFGQPLNQILSDKEKMEKLEQHLDAIDIEATDSL